MKDKIKKIQEDNPDLPEEFIEGVLISKFEIDNGQVSEYTFSDDEKVALLKARFASIEHQKANGELTDADKFFELLESYERARHEKQDGTLTDGEEFFNELDNDENH